MLAGQNFSFADNRPWKNAWSQNFLDQRSQLTARRPFVVQKWPFEALFWDLRLTDTVTAATRSYRQIEDMALLLCCIKKLKSAIAGKVIFRPIYTLI